MILFPRPSPISRLMLMARCPHRVGFKQALRQFLQSDAAVFHLAAIPLEADGAGGGKLHRGFENFAVAGGVGFAALHRDDDFIPLLRFVLRELLVWPGEEVVPTLKLWLADEDAAVGVGGGAE